MTKLIGISVLALTRSKLLEVSLSILKRQYADLVLGLLLSNVALPDRLGCHSRVGSLASRLVVRRRTGLLPG